MITTELLSAVLGLKVHKVIGLDGSTNQLRYTIYPNKGDDPSNYTFPINIYELAHKCKEWAFNNSIYGIGSAFNESWIYHIKNDDFINIEFKCKTEPEAVFAACQWILDQQSSETN